MKRVLATLLALSICAPLTAQRIPIEVSAGATCEPLTARFVALLDGDGSGVVLSGSAFPGAHRVAVSSTGLLVDGASTYPEARVYGASEGEIWLLRGRELGPARGCLGFDKDRFTWASDVLTYVSYLAQLLEQARTIDPSQSTLLVSGRRVELEVSRPGRDRALLRGVEGGMLGYGRKEDEVRYLFVPVLLGADGDTMLLQVLRNRGSAYGKLATESLAWVMVDGSEPVVVPTDPSFEVRRSQ